MNYSENTAGMIESTVSDLEGQTTAAIEQVNKLLSSGDYTPQYVEKQIAKLREDTGQRLASQIDILASEQASALKAAQGALNAISTPDDASLRKLEFIRDTLRAKLQLQADEPSAESNGYQDILAGFQSALAGDDPLLVRAYLMEAGAVLRGVSNRAGVKAYQAFQGMVKQAETKLMTSEQRRAVAVLDYLDGQGRGHLDRLKRAHKQIAVGQIENGRFVDGHALEMRQRFGLKV